MKRAHFETRFVYSSTALLCYHLISMCYVGVVIVIADCCYACLP